VLIVSLQRNPRFLAFTTIACALSPTMYGFCIPKHYFNVECMFGSISDQCLLHLKKLFGFPLRNYLPLTKSQHKYLFVEEFIKFDFEDLENFEHLKLHMHEIHQSKMWKIINEWNKITWCPQILRSNHGPQKPMWIKASGHEVCLTIALITIALIVCSWYYFLIT